MSFTPGGCRDLRQYVNNPKIIEAFGKLISGKAGYTPVVEKRIERKQVILCPNCHHTLTGDEKFCPECGANLKNLEKEKIN